MDANAHGRYREARRYFLRGLARTTAPALVTALQRGLSYAETELGDAVRGLALLDDALGSSRSMTALERGMLLSQRGLVHNRLGDIRASLADYGAAEPLLAEAPEELARIGLNRGNIFVDRGDAAAAIQDYTMAIKQFDRIGRTDGRAKAMHNLGYVHMTLGDLVRSLRLFDEAHQILRVQAPALLAILDQDRAEALQSAGLTDEAETLLRSAASRFGARRIRLRQADAEMSLAQLLAWDDPRSAARVAMRAARRFERAGAPHQALRCRAIKAACDLSRGVADQGEAEALLDELRRLGIRRDAQLLQVLLAGARGQAHALRLPPNTPLPLRLIAADLRAAEAEADGHDRRAMRIIRDALDQLAGWQATFGSLDLQTSAAGHAQPLLERGLRLAVATGRPSVVHQWIERTGALTGRLNPLRPPADPAVAERLARLRALSQEDDPSTDDLHERDQLLRTVRERSWMGEGAAELHDLVTIGRLQAELADCDATKLAFFTVGSDAFALLVTATSSRLSRLCGTDELRAQIGGLPADLDLAAADLPPMIAESVVGSLRERLARLDDLILGPVRGRLRARRVVINPIGAFSGLPWTLMPSLAGRSVTIPRSASAWVTARAQPHEYATSGFAAGPRLPRANEEVAAASAHWPGAEVLTGSAATADAVGSMAGHVDLLHLAAHGHHVTDNPLFSNLELVDGPWFGYDLDQLPQVPETVILSACELGATTIRRGDELLGLTTAWLHAGARCVIASPASVSDEVAAAILPDVHAELAKGVPPADALATATAKHPDLLSTFQCYGAGW
ncbi:MAG: CHAT domain-containing protein [Propionibacteriaceae bacterium]|jgi:tetratricopeptide (TPR) repeat protein|nr:CHAT domain-containing protein [Propionibacteriaceae bacterium]